MYEIQSSELVSVQTNCTYYIYVLYVMALFGQGVSARNSVHWLSQLDSLSAIIATQANYVHTGLLQSKLQMLKESSNTTFCSQTKHFLRTARTLV